MSLPSLKLTAAFGFGPNEVPHRAVAVSGRRAGAFTTSDGDNWTLQDETDGERLAGVAWGPDGVVAVGAVLSGGVEVGVAKTSPDGRTWTDQPITSGGSLESVVHASDIWVAVGADGRVLTSPDAATWTDRTSGVTEHLLAVAWSGSLLVAVGEDGVVVTSTDGVTWDVQTPVATFLLRDVVWADGLGLWVAVGAIANGEIWTSPDAETWTEQDPATGERLHTVGWSPDLGLLAAAGSGGVGVPGPVQTSPDGINWTEQTGALEVENRGIVWAPELGLWILVAGSSADGGGVQTSPDGVAWTAAASTPTRLDAVAWSPPVLADLTGRMRVDPGVNWSYGRSSALDRIVAGQGSVRLDNMDRALDPSNENSPFWPDVRPMVRLTLTADDGTTVHPVFNAYAEGWGPGWPGMADAIVDVPLVDGFKLLSMAPTLAAYPEQTSGARINALLDAAGWPTNRRDVDVGQSPVQAYDASQRIILDAIQDAAATEDGIFYIDPSGVATFRNRHRRILGTPVATFGDDGAELRYRELSAPFDDATIWNDVAVDPDGFTVQRAEDDNSQRFYGRRLLERTTLHTTELEASDLAHWLLGRHATPEQRVDAIVIQGHRSSDLMGQALERRLGHRLTVKRRPPGNGDPMALEVHIEQVSHVIGAGTWETSWRLSPAHLEVVWSAEIPGFSEAGTTTRAGY